MRLERRYPLMVLNPQICISLSQKSEKFCGGFQSQLSGSSSHGRELISFCQFPTYVKTNFTIFGSCKGIQHHVMLNFKFKDIWSFDFILLCVFLCVCLTIFKLCWFRPLSHFVHVYQLIQFLFLFICLLTCEWEIICCL